MEYRYFKAKGQILAKIAEIKAKREVVSKKIQALVHEMGAESYHTYTHGGFAGFMFKTPPQGGLFKKTKKGLWFPVQNRKAGKELLAKIKAEYILPQYDDALIDAGLMPHFPCLIEGTKGYCAYLQGHFETQTFFVIVPWREVDPAEMDQYKKDREAGIRSSAELEHLLWESPADWIECKEWEYLRDMDEAKKTESTNQTPQKVTP